MPQASQTHTTETLALLLSVLCDACRQAIDPALPLQDAIRLFRSVVALARAVRLGQRDAGGAQSFSPNDPIHRENPDLGTLLSAVLAAVCRRALEPGPSLNQLIGLHRMIVSLERAARLAPVQASRQTMIAQQPIRREEPPPPAPAAARRPEMAWDVPDPDAPPPEPESPLSAWRNDHTAPRDQQAHDRLKIVLEDRVHSRVHAEAQRLIAEREAWEQGLGGPAGVGGINSLTSPHAP